MSTGVFFGQDRWIKAECVVGIPPDKINDLFSIERLTEYYINPNALLRNVNDLVENQWSSQYGRFESFNWKYNWFNDYQKLVENRINSSIFNIEYRNVPHDIDIDTNGLDVETKTGLEFALLNKWCNQRIHNSLIDGSYEWFYPVIEGWEMGQDYEPKPVKQAIGKMGNHYKIAVENKADLGNTVARLILPNLFLVFWCLEHNIAGNWSKPLSVKQCINPSCEGVYFKYYRKNDHSLWCSPRCGASLRMQKHRQKKQEQMIAVG